MSKSANQVTDADKVEALTKASTSFAKWVGDHPFDIRLLVMLTVFQCSIERINGAKNKAELQQALESEK